ncbi:MAG: hypothetical protein HYV07_22220 [Deltaproteobacteria bacterium]|nr:hypothetical protein [Deltaproteobacteria bacterium]
MLSKSAATRELTKPVLSLSKRPARPSAIARAAAMAPVRVEELLRKNVTTPEKGLLVGFGPRAVSAVLLGVSAVGALTGASVAHAETIAPADAIVTEADAAAFREAAARFERMKSNLSPSEIEAARRELHTLYARMNAGGTLPVSLEETRGERRMRELTTELESRMRVTAYDMAHPETLELIDGAPGYKRISESEVRRLVLGALRDIPLEELPGGSTLASLVRSLPGGAELRAEKMSIREVERALGRNVGAMLDARFGGILRAHKVEAGIVGFASVTALRASSPEVARALNRVIPRIRLYDVESSDGALRTGASLRYRETRVLPDVDVSAEATREIGALRLRADLRATLSIENDEHVSGTATVGARYGNELRWAELTGTVDHNGRVTTNLGVGVTQPDEGLALRGNVYANFGSNFSVGNSSGRMGAEVDLTRDVRIGNARGDVGFYAAHERDFDGRNADTRAGVMFRLRF